MALHLTPAEHTADPPSGWTVCKGDKWGKRWQLLNKDGGVIDTFATKKEAESAKVSGYVFDLYRKEGQWFNGEAVSNWKPYTRSKAWTGQQI